MKPKIVRLATEFAGIAAFFLSAPIPAFSQQLISAKAGIVHFLEGEVYLNGTALKNPSGRYPQMENEHLLSTGEGYAELLLAPDACLRLGGNASLLMLQNKLADIRLELNRGSAIIEILKTLETDPIRVHVSEGVIEVRKDGLYRIDAEPGMLRVYGGDALAIRGKRKVRVKNGRMAALNGEPGPEKFDVDAVDALHRWAAQRSFALYAKNLFFTGIRNPRELSWVSRPDGLYNRYYRLAIPPNKDWNRYWIGVWSVFMKRAEETARRRRTDPDSILTPEQKQLLPPPQEQP